MVGEAQQDLGPRPVWPLGGRGFLTTGRRHDCDDNEYTKEQEDRHLTYNYFLHKEGLAGSG